MSNTCSRFWCIRRLAECWLRMFIFCIINEFGRVDKPLLSFLVFHNGNAAFRVDFKQPACIQVVSLMSSRVTTRCRRMPSDENIGAYHFGLSAKST